MARRSFHFARGDDRGVSPVVGMILVLGISVVGIAAILYWGLPAIDEMKANVEYRNVQAQFSELDSTVHELVAGTTEKTAKRWEPSINRGEIGANNSSEGFVYSTELYDPTCQSAPPCYNFTYSDLSDGDNWFNITTINRSVSSFRIEGYIVTGSSSQTALNITDDNRTMPATMSSVNASTWNAGTKKTISVWQANVCCASPASSLPKQPLSGATFHFKLYSGSQLIAEMWWVQTGRVQYTLHAGVGDKYVILNNGALIGGANGAYSIVNTPSIPPDTTSAGVPRFFGRAISLTGSASMAGDNRFSLLISLYSTATLASYDCSDLSAYTDCVQSSKIETFGTYGPVWSAYLTTAGLGYHFISSTDPLTGTTVLQEFNHHMAYTLLGSTMKVSS